MCVAGRTPAALSLHDGGGNKFAAFTDNQVRLGVVAILVITMFVIVERMIMCVIVIRVGAAIFPAAMAMVIVELGRIIIFQRLGCFTQESFAVGDRYPVIVRVDFAEGQKAMAIAAIFNEGRLQ